MKSAELLDRAETILCESPRLGPHSLRAACWLARVALEDELRRLLRDRSFDAGGANTRSILTVLSVAYADMPSISRAADRAWVGLSTASHHHAYELGPSLVEVKDLIKMVRLIAEASSPT